MTKKQVAYTMKRSKMFLFFNYNDFSDGKVFLPTEFKKDYKVLPIFFLDDWDNDQIFHQLNVDRNPMGEKTKQEWLRENNVGHTSMSVGDMVIDNKSGKQYVCLSVGWAEVVWIEDEKSKGVDEK